MSEHTPCEHCPCWRQYMKDDWSEPIYVEKLGADGKTMFDSLGKTILLRDRESRPLSWGACCARLPDFGPNTQTHVTMRSDWWCESKEKHEAIARAKRAGNGMNMTDQEKAEQKWAGHG